MAEGTSYSVGQLARRSGLSRSTLLYYDSIGLLKPTRVGAGDYRRYSEDDARRLEQICLYRQTGLGLAEIARLLQAPANELGRRLEERLGELNQEMLCLRRQQDFILGILQNPDLAEQAGVMNRQTWVKLLQASGFGPADMLRWHMEFERQAPTQHRRFLEFLGIAPGEIEEILRRSRAAAGEPD